MIALHTRFLFLAPFALLAINTPSTIAQSLMSSAKSEHTLLFYDTQARRVGDLITVVINEDSIVRNTDRRSLNKDGTAKNKFGFIFGAKGTSGSAEGELNENLDASSERGFNGRSSYQSARLLTDRITVVVRDVLPNGNLIIAGRRCLKIDGEERAIRLSGVVRPIDIRADNTVQSRFIANFSMNYEAMGTETRFLQQGWFSKAANRVWPF